MNPSLPSHPSRSSLPSPPLSNQSSQNLGLAVLSGEKKFPGRRLLLATLRIPSFLYSCLMQLRNRLYDHNIFTRHNVDVPIISVGNITTGGTGKTPMVALLCQHFTQQGKCVGIISRGYGSAKPGELNDEALLIQQRFPAAIIICHPDRVLAAKRCLSQGAQIIIADDAFSHRRLKRNINILMLAKNNPWGYQHVLPRGLLRESLSGLKRAQLFITQAPDTSDLLPILRQHNSLAPLFCAQTQPDTITHLSNDAALPSNTQTVTLASGIAHPQHFQQSIETMNLNITAHQTYPDHHHYTQTDINTLQNLQQNTPLIITEKDAVKLKAFQDQLQNTYVLKINLAIDHVGDFFNKLNETLGQAAQ